MTIKSLVQNSDVKQIVPGKVTKYKLPKTEIFQNIILEYSRNGAVATDAEIKSDIKKIELKFGDKILWSLGSDDLLFMNAYHKIFRNSGFIYIPFSRDSYKNPNEALSFALGLDGLNGDFVLQVEFDRNAVNPDLTIHNETTMGTKALTSMFTLNKETISVEGDTKVWDNLYIPADRVDGLSALFFKSNEIEKVEIFAGKTLIYEMNEELNNMRLRNAGRFVSADWFVVDFMIDNVFSDLYILDKNIGFTVKLTFKSTLAAKSIDVLVDRYVTNPINITK